MALAIKLGRLLSASPCNTPWRWPLRVPKTRKTLQTLDTGPARYSRQCVLSRKVMKDPVVQSVTKEIAERLKTELAISKPAEWYKLLTREHLANTQDGRRILELYNYSVAAFLNDAYQGDFVWYEWLFTQQRVPAGFWRDSANQQAFFDWTMQTKEMTSLDGWYKVTGSDIAKMGGRGLIGPVYNYSIIKFCRAIKPSHDWLEWRFQATSREFWDDHQNHRKFLDWAGNQLKITKMEQWYSIKSHQLDDLGGATVLTKYYRHSVADFVEAVYPEHDWIPWKFPSIANGFWNKPAHHKLFLEWATKQLGYTKLDDWYQCDTMTLHKLGGGGLVIKHYNHSMIKLLMTVYPKHEWLEWRFRAAPQKFWRTVENQRRYMDWMAKQVGVLKMEDWYDIDRSDLVEKGDSFILSKFKSLADCLLKVYPEHQWDEVKLRPKTQGYYRDAKNLRRYIEWAAQELDVLSLSDWYEKRARDIVKLDVTKVLNTHQKNWVSCLQKAYPEHSWDENRLPKTIPIYTS